MCLRIRQIAEIDGRREALGPTLDWGCGQGLGPRAKARAPHRVGLRLRASSTETGGTILFTARVVGSGESSGRAADGVGTDLGDRVGACGSKVAASRSRRWVLRWKALGFSVAGTLVRAEPQGASRSAVTWTSRREG